MFMKKINNQPTLVLKKTSVVCIFEFLKKNSGFYYFKRMFKKFDFHKNPTINSLG